jgi:hypothetical protein
VSPFDTQVGMRVQLVDKPGTEGVIVQQLWEVKGPKRRASMHSDSFESCFMRKYPLLVAWDRMVTLQYPEEIERKP